MLNVRNYWLQLWKIDGSVCENLDTKIRGVSFEAITKLQWWSQWKVQDHSPGSCLVNIYHITMRVSSMHYFRCVVFYLIKVFPQQGVEFAKKLRSASSTLFAVHASLKQPMLKSTVLSACHLMESIKILLSSFYKWSMVMSESLMQIAQYVTMLALSVVSSVQVFKRISHVT